MRLSLLSRVLVGAVREPPYGLRSHDGPAKPVCGSTASCWRRPPGSAAANRNTHPRRRSDPRGSFGRRGRKAETRFRLSYRK